MDNKGIQIYNNASKQSREYAINSYKEIQDMNDNISNFVGRQNMNVTNNNYTGKKQPNIGSNVYPAIKMNNTQSNIRIKNVNQKAIKGKNNKIVKQRITIFLTSMAIMFFAGLGLGKLTNKPPKEKPQIITVDDNKILTKITVDVHNGDTIYGIACDFYNDDCEETYGTLENYIESIFYTNNIDNPEKLALEPIQIPVVIDENNPKLQEFVKKQIELAELEENDKWVKHYVRFGDTLTSLAALGSADDYVGEKSKEVREIIEYNHLKKLYAGDEIFIINPEIGKVKREIRQISKELIESLKNSNSKTK